MPTLRGNSGKILGIAVQCIGGYVVLLGVEKHFAEYYDGISSWSLMFYGVVIFLVGYLFRYLGRTP